MGIILKTKKALKNNRFFYVVLSPFAKIYYYVFHFYKRNKRFIQNGETVLLQAKKALDNISIHYWLDFGTLLGVYRDNALLPNDLDIDLGVFLKDYSPEIENTMRKHGFKLVKEYSIDDKRYGLEQTYEFEGVTVDLFYYGFDENRMWSHVFVNHQEMTFNESISKKGGLLPIEQYFPKTGFTQVTFLNNNFNIPDPAHDYLEFHYGKDYRIPRKWNYADIENDNINAIYLHDKLGLYKHYV
jgi:hypothetical protein